MIWRNTDKDYGVIARLFHWIMAALVAVMVLLGFYMNALDFTALKLALYDWHKSLGTLVLFLVVLRLLWRRASKPPAALPAHQKWERILAHVAHYTLYLLLFLLPVTGWLMSSAGDFSHSFFGLFSMPDLVEKDETLFRQMRVMHGVLVYILLFVLFLHIAGAVKHHVIDRDITLVRMLRPAVSGPRHNVAAGFVIVAAFMFYSAAGYLFVTAGGPSAAPAGAMATATGAQNAAGATESAGAQEEAAGRWTVDHENSRLAFYAEVYGDPFEAVFPVFEADIAFDPENLGQSRVEIVIPIAKVKSGSEERDGFMVMEDWFFTESFPESRFVAETFRKTGGNQYIAEGTLSIRGIWNKLSLPFSLEISENDTGGRTAFMEAEKVINRLDYGVGQGEWQKTDIVKNPVKVTVSLKAEQEAP